MSGISIDDLWFELQRRVPLYKTGTTMPDDSLLGYDGDPNSVDKDNTSGEQLIYYSPQGTLYQESGGNMWRKSETPNVWIPVGSGSGSGSSLWIDEGNGSISYDGQILYSNVYATESDLPNPGVHHGMFAHVHNTGGAYFSHAGVWVRLVEQSPNGDVDISGDLIVAGSTTLSGDLVIDGDSILIGKSVDSSLIIPFGKIDGDIVPSLTHTYDIGASDLRWSTLYTSHIDTTSTLSRTLTSDTISFISEESTGGVSPTSPIGIDAEVETIDYTDIKNFKETHTIVSTYSAQWTFEHIHMLSRGSFTMDTPNTDDGFGTEREFLCMQSNNFAGDAKYNTLNHTHALVLPFDTQIKKIVIRASATAGDDVQVGIHSNRGLEPIDGYAYTYFLEQPIETQTINFEENFQTKIVTFSPNASASEGDTIGISLSAETAINATSITIVLLCRS